MVSEHPPIGPLLFARGYDAERASHAVSVLLAVSGEAPTLVAAGMPVAPLEVDRIGDLIFYRYDLTLPEGASAYTLDGTSYDVHLGGAGGDLRVGFVSCNGKEEGDFERPEEARQAMWQRLAADHAQEPFTLLIHGGDQIYADGVLFSHPDIARWQDLMPRRRHDVVPGPEAEVAATAFFLDVWRRNVTAAGMRDLLARVPSVAMWDDHDIFDGYGSHPEGVEDSPVGEMLYRVALRFFRLFQAGGHPATRPGTETFALAQPGFTVLLPDLRTERGRRRIMGPEAWHETERHVRALPPQEPLFIVSTVPALGPRLSLLEGLHRIVPGMQKYEDDLRDQWQSRAHRAEWRRFLSLAADRAVSGGPVTFLSGEIHLAGRGEMTAPDGTVLHQLTASGISHPPPPRAFARALGALGALGDAPLEGHPIRLRPLPGGRRRFEAERNYLVLERRSGAWRTAWELEARGQTPWMDLYARRGEGVLAN